MLRLRLWPTTSSKWLAVGACLLAITLFSSQWYIYDATRRIAERPAYYLATSAYIWGVLTPIVLWLVRLFPATAARWRSTLPIHICASLALTATATFVEALAGWWPQAREWPLAAALRHYFTQHTQLSFTAYWVILAAAQMYRLYDQARRREVHAAQLEARLAEARLHMLRTQLQPHFLFNTLQASTMLIYDDPQGAEDVLLALSELLRASLESFERTEIPLGHEIELLKHYAGIQQRRYGERLRFEFDIGELTVHAVPGMLLQPLVENAIHHGIGRHSGEDLISVRAFQEAEQLCLEVRNRNSRLPSDQDRLFSRGVGLANTAGRLEQLYGKRQSLEICNIEPSGVLVTLRLPLHVIADAQRELEKEMAQ